MVCVEHLKGFFIVEAEVASRSKIWFNVTSIVTLFSYVDNGLPLDIYLGVGGGAWSPFSNPPTPWTGLQGPALFFFFHIFMHISNLHNPTPQVNDPHATGAHWSSNNAAGLVVHGFEVEATCRDTTVDRRPDEHAFVAQCFL